MRLLVTTRDEAVLEKAGVQSYKFCDQLTEEAARALLLESAGLTAEQRRRYLMDAIARACGYLPLAISVVGALIRNKRFDWKQALARLISGDLKRPRAIVPGGEQQSVLAALQISVETLPDRERRARFRECVVLPPEVAIPETTLITLWSGILPDPQEARDVAHQFVQSSLMTRDETYRYQLHPLFSRYLHAERSDLSAAHARFVK